MKKFFASKARATGVLAATIAVIIVGRLVIKFILAEESMVITGIEILGLFFSTIGAAVLLTRKAEQPDRSKEASPE